MEEQDSDSRSLSGPTNLYVTPSDLTEMAEKGLTFQENIHSTRWSENPHQ